MKNRKFGILLLALIFMNVVLNAQDATQEVNQDAVLPGAPPDDTGNFPIIESDENESLVGVRDVADENLETILLDNFEFAQGWIPNIPLDFGISSILYRDGGPQEIVSDNNKMVLGIKTIFFRRNYGWMSIDRPYPLIIRNVVEKFSVWIFGQNRRHKIFVRVKDLLGNKLNVSGEEMNFKGWKKVDMVVKDPVIQYDPIIRGRGLSVLGFLVSFIAEDMLTTEPYYLYFDQFSAVISMNTDIVAPDDMVNDW